MDEMFMGRIFLFAHPFLGRLFGRFRSNEVITFYLIIV